MPRPKKTDSSDATSAPTEAVTRPEGISDEVWAIGRQIGNVALAGDYVDVMSGKRPPKDGEALAFVNLSHKLQTKALAKYTRLREGVGTKLQAAFDSYQKQREASDMAGKLLNDPNALMIAGGSANGAQASNGASLSESDNSTGDGGGYNSPE